MVKGIFKFMVVFLVTVHAAPYIFIVEKFPSLYKSFAIRLSLVNGYYGRILRRKYYSSTLLKCGSNLDVHFGAYICYPTVEVGDNVVIEEYCVVSNCSLGNDVILAARVSIMSGAHHHDVADVSTIFRNSKSFARKVVVGDNVWIGTHAVVMSDIGGHCAIGAGAVVTREIDVFSVALGVPAKVVKDRRSLNGGGGVRG